MLSKKKLMAILLGIMMSITIFSFQTCAASSVVTDSFSSTALNRTVNFNVYLPPSYSTNTSKSYPVMYLLHGLGDDNTSWTKNGMQSIVDKAGGKEMIIVMPNGFQTFFIDNGFNSNLKWSTYFHNELIPYVESKYRISAADGKNRAIAGLSMGGYGASYHGFKYPEKFCAVYSMSGAFAVGGIDLSTVINKNNYPAFTMECGTEDSLVYQMNVGFHQKLQSAGIPHEYITRSGYHSWDFWKVCLPKAVVFVSKYLSEAPPTPDLIGDVNLDKNVNAIDFATMRKSLLGLTTLEGTALKTADVNKDGSFNAIDFAYMRKYLLGMIARF